MEPRSTTRRRYLLAAGTAVTGALAGCGAKPKSGNGGSTDSATSTGTPTATSTASGNTSTSGQTTEDYPADTSPGDGYPPTFENQPAAMDFDAGSFRTVSRRASGGSTVEVPLVPLDVAYNLYARGEARIIDARDKLGYEISHVLGAVRSPVAGGANADPTGSWPTSDTVITYCHCPHHLAAKRAATLIERGFEEVYALEWGYQGWLVANNPTAGRGVPPTAKTWTIKGTTDAAAAGGVSYVYDSVSDQVAGAKIASDGSYEIEFAFDSISGSDTVTVGTPRYEVDGSLKSFAGTTVTADSGTENATTGTDDGTTTSDDGGTNDWSGIGRLAGQRFR